MTHWDEEPEDDRPEELEDEQWDVSFDSPKDVQSDPAARQRLRAAHALDGQRRPYRYNDY
jgi:hypothetical protein